MHEVKISIPCLNKDLLHMIEDRFLIDKDSEHLLEVIATGQPYTAQDGGYHSPIFDLLQLFIVGCLRNTLNEHLEAWGFNPLELIPIYGKDNICEFSCYCNYPQESLDHFVFATFCHLQKGFGLDTSDLTTLGYRAFWWDLLEVDGHLETIINILSCDFKVNNNSLDFKKGNFEDLLNPGALTALLADVQNAKDLLGESLGEYPTPLLASELSLMGWPITVAQWAFVDRVMENTAYTDMADLSQALQDSYSLLVAFLGDNKDVNKASLKDTQAFFKKLNS